jgi:hypothetical protein
MLPLFPERALDSSIHTAILVAVVIMWLLTETLGWPFVGFVVGGYLAVILLTHLPSFVVICLEAILTYGLVWAAGTGAMRMRLAHQAFGRERFLLFVLFSVPVRLFVEGVAAPHLPRLFVGVLGETELAMGEFHGIGLVLVPLLANTFWKVGLAFGVVQTGTIVGLTYLAITKILMPLTNLHLGRFELTFESAALDFLHSPRLYFILITTALFAAHNSVRYGWDVGGILVPALMALTLLRPEKFVATLVEVVALVGVYTLALRLPYVRYLNLEGPRRLVSVYAVSFGLKYVVTWAVQLLRIGVYISDFFGFGYLLTSILAARCVTRREVTRVLMPAAVTAVQGFAVGSIIAILFSWAGGRMTRESQARVNPTPPVAHTAARAVLLSQASVRNAEPSPALGDTLRYRRVIDTLGSLLETGNDRPSGPAWVKEQLSGLMHVETVALPGDRSCAWVHDRLDSQTPAEGIPSFLWCGGDGVVVTVPHPLDDPDALWMAAYLAEHADIAALVIAGEDRWMNDRPNSWAVRRLRVRQQLLRRILGDRTTFQLVGCTGGSYIAPRSLAPDLGEQPFSEVLADLQLVFRADYGKHQPVWQELGPHEVLLCVDPSSIERHLADTVEQDHLPPASLARWLRTPERPAPTPTSGFGSAQERLSFPRVLVRAARRWAKDATPGDRPPARLTYLAELFDYRVTPVEQSGEMLWGLSSASRSLRGWGAILLRPFASRPLAILLPDGTARDGTVELAATMFHRAQAEVLWLQDEALHVGLTDRDARVRLQDGGVPAIQMVLRELLKPWGDEPEPERLRAITLLARPSDERAAEVMVSAGRELDPEVTQSLATELPLPDTWRLEYATGKVDDPAGRFFQLDYLQDLHQGASVVLHVRQQALAAIRGSPAQQARLDLYRRLGIAVHNAPPSSRPAGVIESDDVAWWKHLRMYTRSGLVGPLRSLLRSGPKVAVFDHAGGLEMVARDRRTACRVSLVGESPTEAADACWRRP